MVVDKRRDELCEWIDQSTPYGSCQLEVASADASFRTPSRIDNICRLEGSYVRSLVKIC